MCTDISLLVNEIKEWIKRILSVGAQVVKNFKEINTWSLILKFMKWRLGINQFIQNIIQVKITKT